MVERSHAFGEQAYSLLDNVIYFLRKKQVMRRLPRLHQQTILDLGAGYDARLLLDILNTDPGITVTGVDVAFAAELEKNSRFTGLIGNLDEVLNLRDASVDICITLAVIEHLRHPQEFLQEIFRVLRPGGCVLLTTPGPSAKPVLEFMAFKLGMIDAAEIRDHKNYFSKADLRHMFETAGFLPENIHNKTFIFGMNNLVLAYKGET